MTCLGGDGADSSFVDVVGSHFFFRSGFGSRDVSCMAVLCQLSLLERQPFPLSLWLVCGAVGQCRDCLLVLVWTWLLCLV